MSRTPNIEPGRNQRYANDVASDIYARRGGKRAAGYQRTVGWLTAKQTALLARNADTLEGKLTEGELLDPDGEIIGSWSVSIQRNGAGLMRVGIFSELPRQTAPNGA